MESLLRQGAVKKGKNNNTPSSEWLIRPANRQDKTRQDKTWGSAMKAIRLLAG